MPALKKAIKKSPTLLAVNVSVYRSKALGSDFSTVGDVVCEINGGDLLIKQRTTGSPVAAFARGQWVTVNVAPI